MFENLIIGHRRFLWSRTQEEDKFIIYNTFQYEIKQEVKVI